MNSFQIISPREVSLLLPWNSHMSDIFGQTQDKKAGIVLGLGWNPNLCFSQAWDACYIKLNTGDTVDHFEWVRGLLRGEKLKF